MQSRSITVKSMFYLDILTAAGFSEISFLIDVEPANNWSLSFSCHIVVLSNSPTHMYSQYHGSIHSFMRNILLRKTVINIIILISVISVTCTLYISTYRIQKKR